MTTKNRFLALAEQGRSSKPAYVFGALLAAAAFLFGSALTLGATGLTEEQGTLGPSGFALALASFGWLLLGTLAVAAWIHRRPVSSLFAPPGGFLWKRVFLGGAVWLLLYAAAMAVEAALFPGGVRLNPEFGADLPVMAAGLLLIPLQTTAEEVYFRGYLLQASFRWVRNPAWLCLWNGVLFVVPHLGNVEAGLGWAAWTQWAVMGAFLAALTLRAQSLDLAIGVHAANNLAAFLLLGSRDASLPTASLFVSEAPNLAFQNVSLVAASILAFWILARNPASGPTESGPAALRSPYGPKAGSPIP